MDELAIADVDAGVADAATATVVEEQQVARLQLVLGDQRHVHIDEFAGGARQLDAGLLAEQVADEAAAIEAFRRRTAERYGVPISSKARSRMLDASAGVPADELSAPSSSTSCQAIASRSTSMLLLAAVGSLATCGSGEWLAQAASSRTKLMGTRGAKRLSMGTTVSH